jgi:hypothetical protein
MLSEWYLYYALHVAYHARIDSDGREFHDGQHRDEGLLHRLIQLSLPCHGGQATPQHHACTHQGTQVLLGLSIRPIHLKCQGKKVMVYIYPRKGKGIGSKSDSTHMQVQPTLLSPHVDPTLRTCTQVPITGGQTLTWSRRSLQCCCSR